MHENTSSDSSSGSVIYEGLRVQKQRASIMRRSLACLLDLGVLTLIFYFVLIVGILAIGSTATLLPNSLSEIFAIIFAIVGIIAFIGFHSFYFIWYELKKGMTPGKRAMAIRVVSDNGKPLKFSQCLIRELLRIIDIYLVFPGIISMLFTKENKRLGDLLADTSVTFSKSVEQKANYTYMSQENYLHQFEILEPAPIKSDLALIFNNFALQHLILNRPTNKVPTSGQALQILSEHEFNGTSENLQQIQGPDRVKFFAEFCNQTTLAEQKKSS